MRKATSLSEKRDLDENETVVCEGQEFVISKGFAYS